ncbi:phosphotransferase enzyme family protein [Spirochaeta cellobiosiphila]|uniref:phosphotransferase enzyme family protein n=1 Tax=Spirochaeta cellobiosiphila TaxID=504483 RepID=UPI00041CF687|nr:phosphotransferase [Spirochaeta cellobiosiphila]
MMKLSLMRDVFSTVNSDWDCELAAELAKYWKHEENWIKMWRASANFVCYIKKEEQHFVLRFNSDSERSLESIESEIALLQYLKSKKIHISRPILSINDKYVESMKTQYGTFHTCVFERLCGEHKDIDSMDSNDFLIWGESLGKLHNAFKEMPKEIAVHRSSHMDIIEEYLNESQSMDYAELKEYEYLSNWLKTLRKNKENYGLIHYDFELDNVIWNEKGLYTIDFDDSLYSWYVADIAYALRDLFDDGKKLQEKDERFLSFIKGYRNVNNISREELLQMPNFYRLHHFISYKKLQRSIDLAVCEDNSDWMNDLIRKLTDRKNSYFIGF